MRLSDILFEGMMMEPPEGSVVDISGNARSFVVAIESPGKFRAHWIGYMNVHRGISVDEGVVWEVNDVNAKQGYGPLLYDIAMEMVNKLNGVGLMADRTSVSSDAKGIWKKYFEERGDVGHEPLPADMFEEPPFNQRPEYLRYYYFKTSTSMIDSLKQRNKIESEDFEL